MAEQNWRLLNSYQRETILNNMEFNKLPTSIYGVDNKLYYLDIIKDQNGKYISYINNIGFKLVSIYKSELDDYSNIISNLKTNSNVKQLNYLNNDWYLFNMFNNLQSNEFLVVNIFQRKKDGHSINKNAKLLKSYTIECNSNISKISAKIFRDCYENNARAYIDVNYKFFPTVRLKMINIISNYTQCRNLNQLSSAFNSAISKTTSPTRHNDWIIDIDYDDKITALDIDDITGNIMMLYQQNKGYNNNVDNFRIKNVLPTKNGCHIILGSCDFLKDLLKMLEPYNIKGENIKKNNATLLHW